MMKSSKGQNKPQNPGETINNLAISNHVEILIPFTKDMCRNGICDD